MRACSLDRRALASASVRPISASVPAITGRRTVINSVVFTLPWSVLASSRTVFCILPALVVRHQPGRSARARQATRPRSLPLPLAGGDPDNMLGLVHSRELSEFPLGSSVSIDVEGEPPFVSGSVRWVRDGPIAGAAERWCRSDCRRHGRRGAARLGELLRRPARGGTSSPLSKPGVRLPVAVSVQISPRRVTLCSLLRRLSSGLKLVRSIRPEKKRSLSSSNRACEVMPPGHLQGRTGRLP